MTTGFWDGEWSRETIHDIGVVMKSWIYLLGAACAVTAGIFACSSEDAADPRGSSGGGGSGGASGGDPTSGGKSDGGGITRGGTTAGASDGGNAAAGASAGGLSTAGTPNGLAGAGGDVTEGGAGGQPADELSPFAGPYGVAYAAPIMGVDTGFPKQADFEAGALVHWLSELDVDHDIGTAKNLNVGLDGVVQWGRWADGTLAGNDAFALNARQGFHYAIGALSAGLPTSGAQGYVLVGATPVTTGDGSVDVGTATASATAAFGVTTAVGVAIVLSVGGTNYEVTSTGGTATPTDSELTAWDAAQPARIGGVPAKPATGICADGCNLSVQGFFAGASGAQLALVVHIYDDFGGSPTSLSSVLVLEAQ